MCYVNERRGLFFPSGNARPKIQNSHAATQSVSIKANEFRRYFAFYQEQRTHAHRTIGEVAHAISSRKKLIGDRLRGVASKQKIIRRDKR